jgi:hypothetical protein
MVGKTLSSVVEKHGMRHSKVIRKKTTYLSLVTNSALFYPHLLLVPVILVVFQGNADFPTYVGVDSSGRCFSN